MAQRNLQIDDCAYPLTNDTTSDGALGINLTISGVDLTVSGNDVEVFFDDPAQTLLNAWQGGQGYTAKPAAAPGTTVVELNQNSVNLLGATLPAGTTFNASAVITLAPGSPDGTLSVQATLKDTSGNVLVTNGGSCLQHAGIEG